MTRGLSRAEISRMHDVIRPYVRRTPLLHANGSEVGLEPFPLTFKLEFVQHGGSFKVRGAFANLLTREIPPVGVVAASGGNHGVAVACAARRLGVPAKIFVPTVSAPIKIDRIRPREPCVARVLNEVVLNQVLVQFRPPNGDDAAAAALTQQVVTSGQQEGTCWVGGTKWQGQAAMRISISNWSTTAEDVDRSAAAILAAVGAGSSAASSGRM